MVPSILALIEWIDRMGEEEGILPGATGSQCLQILQGTLSYREAGKQVFYLRCSIQASSAVEEPDPFQ